MSTKKPKYPSTELGYFCYLHDYGAEIYLDPINKKIIRCIANSDGHDFRVDFILEKEYNKTEKSLVKDIMNEKFKIVNMRMY